VAVEIVPGAEVAVPDLADLTAAELRLATLGQTGVWLLLEPAPGPLASPLVAVVERLHADHGLRCVIAHPERHVGPSFETCLAELVARGALVQATAAHVLDEGAGPVLADLARRGLVHLVGSDAHSARFGRPVQLRPALAVLERAAPHVAAFAESAPAAILRGERVEPPQPA
jgi:protein-tyrosine phosphatase